MSLKRRKAKYPDLAQPNKLERKMSSAEKEKPRQSRFFCGNCKQEVFLQSKYCANCGAGIEWPEEIKKILATWKQQEKKNH